MHSEIVLITLIILEIFMIGLRQEEDIELRGLRENPEYKNPKIKLCQNSSGKNDKGLFQFKNRVGTGQNGDDECRWGRSSD